MKRMTREEFLAAVAGEEICFGDLGLSELDLSGLDLGGSAFYDSDLRRVNFTGSNLQDVEFFDCDLSQANFTNANLAGAEFVRVVLDGAIGIASKEEETAEAKRILGLLQNPLNALNMRDWHTCETVHCLAGWSCPHEDYPAPSASRKLPSLAQYFYMYDNDDALAALQRVASGEESVWNPTEVW